MRPHAVMRRLQVRPLLWALHPFLFAAYPVLFLFATNIQEQVTVGPIFAPLAVVIVGVALALLVHGVLVRDRVRAGLLTTLAVALVFSYGHVSGAVRDAIPAEGYLLGAWAVLALLGIVMIARLTDARAREVTGALTVAGAALVLINLVPIVGFGIRPAAGAAPGAKVVDADANAGMRRPDIYYLVFDRYAAGSTLEELYGYDNSAFIDSLEQRGFYVAHESHANYLKTSMSMASTLEMNYLDIDALAAEASAPDDFAPVLRLLGGPMEAPVGLKELGYRYFHIGTWYEPTASNSAADVVLRYGALSEFSSVLYDSTLAPALFGDTGEFSEFRESYRRHAQYQFEQLSRIPSLAEPTFALAHFSLPHPPYVFDAEGNPVTATEERSRSPSQNYVAQLEYTNRRVLDLLDRLFDVPAGEEPIILLQADEGPYPLAFERDQESFDWERASADELRQKFAILNAYLLPGIDTSGLYPSISPVNSFRVVFNGYFGTDLELLPDRAYAWNADDAYRLIDVTSRLPDAASRREPARSVSLAFERPPPETWTIGEEESYAVTLTNEGSDRLSAGGTDGTRLGAQLGPEPDAPSQDWLPIRHVNLPGDLAPGASVTVEMTVPAPSDPGAWILRHMLVEPDGSAREIGEQLTVEVASPDDADDAALAASYTADPPTRWAPGETATYDVTVTNRGTETWLSDGEQRVRLSAHFGTDDDRPGQAWAGEARFELPRDVAPGGTVEVEVTLTAPDASGEFVLRQRLVQEDVAWFDNIHRTQVTVATPAWLIVGRPMAAALGWLAVVVGAWVTAGPWSRRRGTMRRSPRRAGESDR